MDKKNVDKILPCESRFVVLKGQTKPIKTHTMKSFKTYEKQHRGIQYFIRYMGAQVEGQCKWYIWSNDFDFDTYTDSLWYTKEEAVTSANYAIFESINKVN
jgi:hypothetical protein